MVPVLLGQFNPRALAHLEAVVLAVLQLAQLRGRSQFWKVPVLDAGLLEGRLESHRVRPGVLLAADTATLANVDDQRDVMMSQLVEEFVEAGMVNADGGDRPHGRSFQD